MCEKIVLELYRSRKLSAGIATKIRNMEKINFNSWAIEKDIPFFDMLLEEWQQEVRAIKKK